LKIANASSANNGLTLLGSSSLGYLESIIIVEPLIVYFG